MSLQSCGMVYPRTVIQLRQSEKLAAEQQLRQREKLAAEQRSRRHQLTTLSLG